MATIFSQIGDVVGAKIKQLTQSITDLDTRVTNITNTKPTYFEQADEPTAAVSGDMWRDTDTGVLACLYVEDGNRVWMEI